MLCTARGYLRFGRKRRTRASMTDDWKQWQGHVINGAFPLRRYLGCSDHSGVFLTELVAPQATAVAIKLVPADPALAESQLSRWERAAGLEHRHLIRLLEVGTCQLGGLPHLYAVMEYADQTLAQLLTRRALTEDEAREMLGPMLDALAFLHHRNLLQGQLKPENILVVGDQLKLASDTIRRADEGSATTNGSVYDPPESRSGDWSTASDIWALGVSLVEALTRTRPSDMDESNEAITLPADFPLTFREIVARCLSKRPQVRPDVAQLQGWLSGHIEVSAPVLAVPPAASVITEPTAAKPALPRPGTARPLAPESRGRTPPTPRSSTQRSFLPVALAALVILALGWAGIRMFSHRNPAPTAPQAVQAALPQSPPAIAPVPAETPATSSAGQVGGDAAAAATRVHEEIPDVPRFARATIRGHIKVWVRVTVGKDGTVSAALPDRPGPSKYFERLAVQAAKKWTFPPQDNAAPRSMQVRFDFSRDGTTGHAVPVSNEEDAQTAPKGTDPTLTGLSAR
jgi:TonB family protein